MHGRDEDVMIGRRTVPCGGGPAACAGAILIAVVCAVILPGCEQEPHGTNPCDWVTDPSCTTPDLGLPYLSVGSFSEGLAGVQLPDLRHGVIDTTGRLLFTTSYGLFLFVDYPGSEYHEGLLVCHESGPTTLYGLLDRDGKTVVAPMYSQLDDFSEGRAVAQLRRGGPFGYVDRTGTFAIQPTFVSAASFSEGLACVAIDSLRHGYIDPTGTMVIDAVYRAGGSFSEGLAPVLTADSTWRYIDRTGAVVFIMDSLGYCRAFSEGRAAVRMKKGNYWAFIDKSGRRVTEWFNGTVGDFHDGMCGRILGGHGSLWGGHGPLWDEYIDLSGNLAFTSPHVSGSTDYSNGYAAVVEYCCNWLSMPYRMGLIDRKGGLVIPITYQRIGPYRDGWFPVQSAGRAGFMNPEGRILR